MCVVLLKTQTRWFSHHHTNNRQQESDPARDVEDQLRIELNSQVRGARGSLLGQGGLAKNPTRPDLTLPATAV